MNEFDAIKYSWDKKADAIKIEVIPMENIYLSPEDMETLREEYKIYCAKFSRDDWNNGVVMSFDEWWRFMVDSAKDRMDGK